MPAVRRLALALAAAVVGCAPRHPPPVTAHYVVGAPYEIGGAWFYPRESFNYRATGLATRLPDRVGTTADGEAFDPTAMAGAHQTLQLPAIVSVTNLENGRRIRIRLNDRGPANPARLIGLTRQAAEIISLPPSGVARVRVEVESAPSQALRDRLQGGPKGIAAAPVGTVVAETLAPPGTTHATPSRVVASPRPEGDLPTPTVDVADRLPVTAEQGSPSPGLLWLEAGTFSQLTYANAIKSKLSGMPVEIQREVSSRMPRLSVRAGPFASVAEADRALDRARAAGVTDAVIVVE